MFTLRRSRSFSHRLVMGAVLAMTMALPTAGPVAAFVLLDPTPTPVPPQQGGRVEVTWAGLAMTFPDDWDVRQKRPPGTLAGGGASILVAFGPSSTTCLIDVYDPALVDSWADVGVEAVARLTLAGLEVERFDDVLGADSRAASAWSIHAPGLQYSLLCASAEPPGDRWLSLVETIELTPIELTAPEV